MILEIDNVELYFKDKTILKGVYLKAETGKATGILGSNGSGKSCLLEIIFGSLKPKYKLIRIDGSPFLKPLFKTKFVKFLPQYHFIPNVIKLKNVFKLYNVDWNTFVDEFIEFSAYENFKVNKLSSGEHRLIETYIVLKSPSKIVLLDEPFSHLAPLHIEKILKLIIIEKEHKAILITDHMYRHIITASDTIYLLKNNCTKYITNILELEDYKYLSEGSLF